MDMTGVNPTPGDETNRHSGSRQNPGPVVERRRLRAHRSHAGSGRGKLSLRHAASQTKTPDRSPQNTKPPQGKGPCRGLLFIKLLAKKPNYGLRPDKWTWVPDFERFPSLENTAGSRCIIVS